MKREQDLQERLKQKKQQIPKTLKEGTANLSSKLPPGATVESSNAEEHIRAINVGNSSHVAHVNQTQARTIQTVAVTHTQSPRASNNHNTASSTTGMIQSLAPSPSPTSSVSHTSVGRDLTVSSVVNNLQPVAMVSHTQARDVYVSSHVHVPSPPITPEQKRVASQQQVEASLQQLREHRLTDETINAELATYIPIQAGNSFDDQVLFDAATKVKEFLASNKKVLLLLGDSGMGKSVFGQTLERELWQSEGANKAIPLFITLTSVQDPIHQVIEGHLSQLGFNPAHIAQLKQEKSFIFILDGYDEIASHHPDNLYVSNQLSTWKAKVIISCRSQYLLAKREIYRNRFLPDYKNQPEPGLFQEIVLKPFAQYQIKSYLKKFVEVEKPIWSNWCDYQKHINLIPDLKRLIETPFLLRITVEVLPDIVRHYENTNNNQRIGLTRANLYEAFAQRWFERQEYKLRKQGLLTDTQWDIKGDFRAFSQGLATQMFQKSVKERE